MVGGISTMSILRCCFLALVTCLLCSQPTFGVIRDGGIDPANLGQGGWLFIMKDATNKLGGNVSTVTNENSLFQYLKLQGMDYVIVKAATSNMLWTGSSNVPLNAAGAQFTSNLVNYAHANGVKIFGSNRSWGNDVPGEIAVADYVFNQGADGFIYDAEAEWESNRTWIGTNGPALAWQLCSTVRAHWPNKFIAHNPFATVYLHFSFPYKEFGFWCDAVMPQVYHYSATRGNACASINWMDVNFKRLHEQHFATLPPTNINGTTVYWTNAIKPLVLMRDVYGTSFSSPHPPRDVMEFIDYTAADPNCVTEGGYNGTDYFRSELHDTAQWAYMKAATVGIVSNRVNNIVIDDARASVNGPWTMVRTIAATTGSTINFYNEKVSDTNAFGTNYWRISQGNGSNFMQFTPKILTAGQYNVYQWHPTRPDASAGVPFVITHKTGSTVVLANQQTNGANWSFLGKFEFTSGTNGNIRVMDNFSEPTAVAMVDGLKLVYSPPVGVPSMPTGLSATALNSSQLRLLWADTSTNETGFVISRSTNFDGPYVDIKTVDFDTTAFTDSNLQDTTTYYYTIRAVNIGSGGGVSATSPVTFATTSSGPPVILQQPATVDVPVGTTASFNVLVSAYAPSFQWRFKSAPISGATASSLTLSNVGGVNDGDYDVVVTSRSGSVVSDAATLRVVFTITTTAGAGGSVARDPDQATYRYNETVTLTALPAAGYGFVGWNGDIEGTNASVTMTVKSNKTATAYFMYAPEFIVDNPQATYVGPWTIGSASADKYGSTYHYAGTAGAQSTSEAFFTPVLPTAGKYNVSINSPGGTTRTTNAQLSIVYSGGTSTLNLNQTTQNSTVTWRRLASAVNFAEGSSGYVHLANNTTETNKLVVADAVKFSLIIAPSFVVQPQSATVPVGATAKFRALASGTGLAYQWRYNGAPIAGATGTAYSVVAAKLSDAGTYDVVVNNEVTSVSSTNAVLTVSFTPAQMTGLTFTGDRHFQFSFSGTAADYAVQSSSNLVDWGTITNVRVSSTPVFFIDPAGTNGSRMFYRMLLLP